MFLVYPWLAPIYNIPSQTLEWIAIVSLIYAAYGILVLYKYIPRRIGVPVLALMNLLWAFVCLGVIYYYRESIHWWAILHFGVEAIFVLALAYFEMSNRKLLIYSF